MAVLILFGLMAFFGTWHAFFLFISSIVNTFVTIRKARAGVDLTTNFLRQCLTGVLLMFFGWLEQAFGYTGYFGQIILGKSGWSNFTPLLAALFSFETLQMIGFSLIINGLLLFLLLRKDGHQQFRRNISIFIGLAVVTILTTMLFNYFGPDYLTYYQGEIYWEKFRIAINHFGLFPGWLLSFTFGGLLPLFPFLTTTFCGAIIGLVLARPEVNRKEAGIGILIGFCIFVLGIIYTVINIHFGLWFSTIERIPSVSTYLLRLGTQVMTIWAFMYFIEFRGRGDIFAQRKIVSFIRFWGNISLTIYILQIFELFPRWILTIIFKPMTGINFLQENFIPQGSEILMVFVVIFTLYCFYYLQRLWSRVNYVGSFEWLISAIRKRLLGTKKMPKISLYIKEIDWINFTQQ
jgi:hypothetical protein